MELGGRVITRAGEGAIAFIGETQFSSGTWLGIILDEPNGKNDGSVQGVQYFKTSDKKGLFVRKEQVQLKSPGGRGATVKTGRDGMVSRARTGIKRESMGAAGQTGSVRGPSGPSRSNTRVSMTPSFERSNSGLRQTDTETKRRQSMAASSSISSRPDSRASAVRESASTPEVSTPNTPKSGLPQEEPPKFAEPVTQQKQEEPVPIAASTSTKVEPGVSLAEFMAAKAQAKDWKSRCDSLQIKRREDTAKIRDAERLKVQLEGLKATNTRLTASLKDINKKYESQVKLYEEKMDETSDAAEAIENAVLEKEMAEAKMEEVEEELANLKEKLEEVETDYEILRERFGGFDTFCRKTFASSNSSRRRINVFWKILKR